jgi:hypothetical protein
MRGMKSKGGVVRRCIGVLLPAVLTFATMSVPARADLSPEAVVAEAVDLAGSVSDCAAENDTFCAATLQLARAIEQYAAFCVGDTLNALGVGQTTAAAWPASLGCAQRTTQAQQLVSVVAEIALTCDLTFQTDCPPADDLFLLSVSLLEGCSRETVNAADVGLNIPGEDNLACGPLASATLSTIQAASAAIGECVNGITICNTLVVDAVDTVTLVAGCVNGTLSTADVAPLTGDPDPGCGSPLASALAAVDALTALVQDCANGTSATCQAVANAAGDVANVVLDALARCLGGAEPACAAAQGAVDQLKELTTYCTTDPVACLPPTTCSDICPPPTPTATPTVSPTTLPTVSPTPLPSVTPPTVPPTPTVVPVVTPSPTVSGPTVPPTPTATVPTVPPTPTATLPPSLLTTCGIECFPDPDNFDGTQWDQPVVESPVDTAAFAAKPLDPDESQTSIFDGLIAGGVDTSATEVNMPIPPGADGSTPLESESHYVTTSRVSTAKTWGSQARSGSQTVFLHFGGPCNGSGPSYFASCGSANFDNAVTTMRNFIYGYLNNTSHTATANVTVVLTTNNSGPVTDAATQQAFARSLYAAVKRAQSYAQAATTAATNSHRTLRFFAEAGDDIEDGGGFHDVAGTQPLVKGFSDYDAAQSVRFQFIVDSGYTGTCAASSCWNTKYNRNWTPHIWHTNNYGYRAVWPFPQNYNYKIGYHWAALNKAAAAVGASTVTFEGVMGDCEYTETSPQDAYYDFAAAVQQTPPYLTDMHTLGSDASTC